MRKLLFLKDEARNPLVLKEWGEGDRVADWRKIAGN